MSYMLIDKSSTKHGEFETNTTAFDNVEFAVCILPDFRKAFDTVEHSIPLDKSYHYGIKGNTLYWL